MTAETTDTEPTWRDGLRRLRSWLAPSADDRLATGLAAGIGERLGIAPAFVRAAFVSLAFAGGAGVVLYLAGWLLGSGAEPPPDTPPVDDRRRASLVLIFAGTLLLFRSLGIWFGDSTVWPVVLVSFGLAVMWSRTENPGLRRLARLAAPGERDADEPARGRVILGSLLMFMGLVVAFSTLGAVEDFGTVMFAVAITAGGFLLVFGPWVWRLANDLTRERHDRIRSEERADVAAHLHDSVLQTLALIQRTDEPKKMVTLARAQERELREWLYGREDGDDGGHLAGAIRAAAARVEADHDVPVDVVVVGDAGLDDAARALVQATGEAMTNAARHSEAALVSVYVEAADGRIEAWISDQGRGFDASAVPDDRRGIADSIVGRMQRYGGRATITSDAEDGTEVHLVLSGEVP